MILNLGIAGLNLVKIKATERLIASTGPRALSYLPCLKNLPLLPWQMVSFSLESRRAGGFWRPYFLYVGLSAAYAFCAGATVAFWAPAAAGSGMSEIKVHISIHAAMLYNNYTLQQGETILITATDNFIPR